MRRIIVDIVNYLDKLPNYEELMPKEFAISTSWIQVKQISVPAG